MKRLIALLCLLAICLPLCACSSSLESTATVPAEKATEEQKTESTKKENDEIVYPKDCFSVGYARVDITPKEVLPIFEGTGDSAHDPLQLTVTALCDGESAALLISVDVRSIRIGIAEACQRLIELSVKVPADRVLINATHTHSAPAPGFDAEKETQWVNNVLYKQLIVAVKEALRDLTPAEAYTGVSHTDGITFVRRYLKANGKYQTNASAADNPVAHESVADNEMRVIRFEREGKKDVLMVNYQTHYGGAPSLYPNQYSADFVHTFRQAAETELDCLFTYHSGASGNLNFNSPISGEKKCANFVDATEELMRAAKDAVAKEEKAVTDKLRSASSKYAASVIKESEERLTHAKEVNSLRSAGKDFHSLLNKYGFASKYEATAVIMRAGLGENPEIPFTAISCGDLAFVSAPYEMFDSNGQEVRAASPFKTTFICSLTNGSFGYVPSALAVPHGSYEVIITYFEYGSAEKFVAEMVRLLGECKNAN